MRLNVETPKTRYRSVKYRLSRDTATSFNFMDQRDSNFMTPKPKHTSVTKPRLSHTTNINKINSDLNNI